MNPILRRLDHKDTDSIDKAIVDGFNFIGTLHSYELNIPDLRGDIHIKRGSNDHLDGAIRIGLSGLWHSRFYADPKIPFKIAQNVYEERIRRAFESSIVFVALHYTEVEGYSIADVIGFCSLLDDEIELIAVMKDYQRQGVGRLLIEHCIDECKRRGIKRLKVKTQGSNRSARNFYEKLGFQPTQIEKDFHKRQLPRPKGGGLL